MLVVQHAPGALSQPVAESGPKLRRGATLLFSFTKRRVRLPGHARSKVCSSSVAPFVIDCYATHVGRRRDGGCEAGAASPNPPHVVAWHSRALAPLVDGVRYYRWIEDHAPLARERTRRLADAFNETGRGLFVSVGLTGLVQGILATVAYFALGVPRALVLGLLTCVASLIPSIGTALV